MEKQRVILNDIPGLIGISIQATPRDKVIENTWQKLYELNKAVNPDFKHCHIVDMENGTGLELQYRSDFVENSYRCEDTIGLKASTKDAGSIEITAIQFKKHGSGIFSNVYMDGYKNTDS